MNSLQSEVVAAFEQQYQASPTMVVRAPGRVNLIGDHTDYNDGFVLPMAIDRAVWLALRPTNSPTVTVHALNFGETAAFSLNDLQKTDVTWLEYIKGVAWALQQANYTLTGWEGVFKGNVPIGSGLSSSAALELAAARAFAGVADVVWQGARMAQLSQQAENEWMGMNCGIMDQMISAVGVAEQALLIDCRSLETQSVPLPPETAVVVLDTTVRRGLVDSAYNERRAQCEAVAQFFNVPALRDVTYAQFEQQADALDPVALRRARHVITENERVLQAAEAMRQGDSAALGRLMNESHASLRDDFEVSCPELDAIVTCAQQHPAGLGARLTGAGFGGCAVALVRAAEVDAFVTAVATCYQQATNLEANIYVCQATDGAKIHASVI